MKRPSEMRSETCSFDRVTTRHFSTEFARLAVQNRNPGIYLTESRIKRCPEH
jgi:hypothetical protein